MKRIIPGIVLALAALIGWGSWLATQPALVEIAGATMGTTYSVKIRHLAPSTNREALATSVQRLLDDIEGQMSTYRTDSEVSRFSQFRGDDWFAVSDATAHVVATSLKVSQSAEGAFDVTVAPLVNLWGFGPQPRTGEIPSEAAISAARQRVGYQFLEARLSPPALRKRKLGVAVDLSAIAKGYAVDAVALHLDALGLKDYLVEIAGETKACGHRQGSQPWRVGIESPLDRARQIRRVINLSNLALATSGDYRNFFERDGHRYCHEIDPRTGWPIAHNLASVSVVHVSAEQADALATALMVLGPEKGCEWANQQQLAVYWILRDERGFQEKMTAGFEKLIGQTQRIW